MNIEELRDYCLSKTGVDDCSTFIHNTASFKVIGKVFLFFWFDESPLKFNIKCDPEKAVLLRDRFDCVQPGYLLYKKHWITVIADGSISTDILKEWVTDSYNLVVSGFTQVQHEQLDWLRSKQERCDILHTKSHSII